MTTTAYALNIEQAGFIPAVSSTSSHNTIATQFNPITYLVSPGDHLYAIAASYAIDGVSLERMIDKLFELNPKAFINGNRHHLKTGWNLTIPKPIDFDTANIAYAVRKTIAMPEMVTSEVRLMPALNVEHNRNGYEKSYIAYANNAPNLNNSQSKAPVLESKVNTLHEEMLAMQNTINEMQITTAQLDKQIAEMQRLLALKHLEMLRLREGEFANDANTDTSASQQMPLDSADNEPELSDIETTQTDMLNAPVTDYINPNKTKFEVKSNSLKQLTPQKTTNEVSQYYPVWIVPLLKRYWHISTIFWVILLAIPLVGALLLHYKLKQSLPPPLETISPSSTHIVTNLSTHPKQDEPTTDNDKLMTKLSAFTMSDMVDDEIDPIAEAEVYMAYGNDAQAEEILKDAIIKAPKQYELHLKLLELYFTNRNVTVFEKIAQQLQTQLNEKDECWLKIVAMGHKLDPSNALYQQTANLELLVQAFKDELIAKNMPVSDTRADNSESLTTKSANDTLLDFNTKLELTPTSSANYIKNDSLEKNYITPQSTDFDYHNKGTDNTVDDMSISSIHKEINASEETVDTFSDQLLAEPTIEVPTLQMPVIDMTTFAFTNSFSIEKALLEANQNMPRSQSLLNTPTLDASEMFKSLPSLHFDDVVTVNHHQNDNLRTILETNRPYTSVATSVEANSQSNLISDPNNAVDATNGNAKNILSASEDVEIIETKLDLIKAYIDMQDIVGAKELIDEVLEEGVESQRQRASALLSQLA